MGTINPLANDVPGYWDGLKKGQSVIRPLQYTDLSSYHARIGGEVDYPENIRDYFKRPRMVKRLDRNIVFAHVSGMQAIKDAGLDIEKEAWRCGAIIGTGAGGIKTHETNIFRIFEGNLNEVSPFYIVSVIPNTATSHLALENGIRGPTFSVNSACASGNHAIGLSIMMMKAGMADIMLAGGTEAALNAPGMTSFGSISALSTRNDEPHLASRPFDADRDGFTMGEGAGVLVLETLEHAKSRGANIYAEISGFGFTSDAYDLVAPHPKGESAVKAMHAAMDMAGLKAKDIGLINAHGTSTPLGDYVEGLGINAALGTWGSKVPVHSTKSMIGHLLGGASAVEAIASIMVFQENVIHATANHRKLDPEINLNVVTENMDGSNVDHILSNAFGFGGMNAVIILSRYKD